MRREWIICLLLAVITLAVFWPVRNNDYVYYDDHLFITDNPYVQAGLTWHTVQWALTAAVASNWHPVTTLSHALDCELFGVNPGMHHLVSLLLHAANALLLFLFLRRATGALWRSAIVAAIFALHPLRVESVAWVAERKDVLSMFFLLLTLLAYERYARALADETTNAATGGPGPNAEGGPRGAALPQNAHARSSWWRLLALGCFMLGLMSKPMLVTLPFVLLLLDYWPLQRFRFQTQNSKTGNLPGAPTARSALPALLQEKLPFFGAAAVVCWLTMQVAGATGGVTAANPFSTGERMANAVSSYLQYLGKLFCPTRLAVLYPHPAAHYPVSAQWPGWQLWAGALLLLAISAFCLLQLRRRPFLAVGWLWYLGTLVPVIGLVHIGQHAMADRYTYLPLVGPVLCLVWLGSEWWKPTALRAGLLTLPLVAALCLCATLTRRQISYWRNMATLFEHAVEVTADNPVAQCNLGFALNREGQPSLAAVRFRAALAIDPRYLQAHVNFAIWLRDHQYWAQAAEHFLAATRLNPNADELELELVDTLRQSGQTKEAVARLQEALRRNRAMRLDVLNNLAWALATSEQPGERDGAHAVLFAERACSLSQWRQGVLVGTLAAAYAEAGRFAEAVTTAQMAVSLAGEAGDRALQEKNQQLLELYRAQRPYREHTERAQAN